MTRYAPEIILVILIIGGYFGYRSYKAYNKFNDYVQESFVKPYTDLIMSENENEAYVRFTSDQFKSKYSLNEYLKSYKTLRNSRGNHISSNYISKQGESVDVFNDEKVYLIGVGYSFEKNSKMTYLEMVFELIDHPEGGFLLNNSYTVKKQHNPEGLSGPW
jgi:hypothetical protein